MSKEKCQCVISGMELLENGNKFLDAILDKVTLKMSEKEKEELSIDKSLHLELIAREAHPRDTKEIEKDLAIGTSRFFSAIGKANACGISGYEQYRPSISNDASDVLEYLAEEQYSRVFRIAKELKEHLYEITQSDIECKG